jgi:hypothetical protein
MRKWKWIRAVAIMMVAAFVVGACSSSDDSGAELTVAALGVSDEADFDGPSNEGELGADEAFEGARSDGTATAILAVESGASSIDARVIRDGMVDLRIAPDSFGAKANQIRAIAADLGGYVSSGEASIEVHNEERYAVGWSTIRIPSDRFDDAVARVEALGEPVSSSMSSQDVTEEYVDLEGRLNYWREQEGFYSRLMEEATTIEDLVAVQTQMQDVLLNIEQIEGRLRYLDSRTEFATLTVGLTEVPAEPLVAPGPTGEGPIAQAFSQAGDVLLATVSFIIVATAALIPIVIIAVFAFLVARLFLTFRRKRTPAET